MTFSPETKIVEAGNWTDAFSGSPTLSARKTLDTALDLNKIKNLKLELETTGAHETIYVRLENTSGRYAQFNMGGNMTGDTGTRTHQLEVNMEAVTRVSDVAADFDPTDIASILIQMNDDAGQSGNPTVDIATVEIGYDDEVAHTIGFQEGFSTLIEARYDKDGSTIQMPIRPVNPTTGEYITKTIVTISDNIDQDLKDYNSPTPNNIGKIYGEVFLVEYNSTDETSGVHTFNVLQSGGGHVTVPVSLGSFRNSLKFASHAKNARLSTPLLKGLIDAGRDDVLLQQAAFETSINDQQENFETSISNSLANAVTQIKTKGDDLQLQQETYESDINQQQTNFESSIDNKLAAGVDGQILVALKWTDENETTFDVVGGAVIIAGNLFNYAGITAQALPAQTTYYELNTAGALASNTLGFTSGYFPIGVIEKNGSNYTIRNYEAKSGGGGGFKNISAMVYSGAGLLETFTADGKDYTLTYNNNETLNTVSDGSETATLSYDASGNLTGISTS